MLMPGRKPETLRRPDRPDRRFTVRKRRPISDHRPALHRRSEGEETPRYLFGPPELRLARVRAADRQFRSGGKLHTFGAGERTMPFVTSKTGLSSRFPSSSAYFCK